MAAISSTVFWAAKPSKITLKSVSMVIDRIYAKANDLLLREGPRRLSIESENLPDAVIWNPGPEKCAHLKDMPADGWQHMLCVEAARIMEPATLGPDRELERAPVFDFAVGLTRPDQDLAASSCLRSAAKGSTPMP